MLVTSVSSSYSSDPFYFDNRDPLLWYALGYHSGYSRGSSMSMGGGGGSNDCSGEALAIACGIACVCSAGACCALCTKTTIEGPESDNVKTAKVSASALATFAVFSLVIYFLNKNDTWHQDLVEDHNWDEGGYRFFLFLVSAFGGLLSGGAVSTVNNIFQCLPQLEDEISKPSAEVLEALKDLAVIEELLTKGWKREGGDVEQCNALIREVVTMYIATIAARPLQIRVEVPSLSLPVPSAPVLPQLISPPSYSSSQSTLFGKSSSSMVNDDCYVQLPGNDKQVSSAP